MMPGGVSRKDADGLLKLIDLVEKDPGLKKSIKAIVKANDESREVVAAADGVNAQITADKKAVQADREAVDADIQFVQERKANLDEADTALQEREDKLSEGQRSFAKDKKAYKITNEEAAKIWAESDNELKTREDDLNSRAEALDVRQDRIAEREASFAAETNRQAEKVRRIEEIRAS